MFDGKTFRAQQLEAFRNDVLTGLARDQKSLPSRWLYDERGSDLFTTITKLDEYYPTRTEIAILRTYAKEIAQFCSDSEVLLEYGPGAGVKSELLIKALKNPRVYVPVDIAGEFLEQASARLRRKFPLLQTDPVDADFTEDFALPPGVPKGCRLGFFPGSTIGNLDAEESRLLLRRLRRQVGKGGRAIIGADLKKDLDVLLPAYDDHAGVTAKFNINILARINRELGGTFVAEWFGHEARWNPTECAVEMHLKSRREQCVRVSGHDFTFAAGETIHTESSRKYDVAGFAALVNANGWKTEQVWTDERGYFSVFGLLAEP